jgi:hypothetical protein
LFDAGKIDAIAARVSVVSEAEAGDIFNKVKREVQRILAHWAPLPDRDITTYLVNRDQFVKEYRRTPGIDNPENLLGLTRSRHTDETNSEHYIYLLNGVPKPQFMAVCAHEYSHTWLNEHQQRSRTLDKDTIEGFCELVAYKFCALNNETNEMNRILASDYTRHQIDALVAADERYQFHRVIQWILEGVDSWLDQDKLERLLAVKKEGEELAAAFAWLPTVTAPGPDTLILKSISGSAGRRFALINNRTFATNEEGKVRVGQSNVIVRCVEIRDKSVVLQIKGQNGTLELALAPSRPGR